MSKFLISSKTFPRFIKVPSISVAEVRTSRMSVFSKSFDKSMSSLITVTSSTTARMSSIVFDLSPISLFKAITNPSVFSNKPSNLVDA